MGNVPAVSWVLERMYPVFTRTQLQPLRREAAELFAQDLRNAEVAGRLGVRRPTVSGGRQRGQADQANGRTLRPAGPHPRLTPAHQQQLAAALLQGAQAHGYATQLWTLGRMAEGIARLFCVHSNPH